MIPIDTIVSIKSGDEYGGKYTGKLGIIKKFTDDRVGVEFAGLKNHASKYGLFSGPKTIVFWLDGTKTIVSCGEGDDNDPYAGFCAAVTKRVFGSTSQAKKVLARTRKETSK